MKSLGQPQNSVEVARTAGMLAQSYAQLGNRQPPFPPLKKPSP